MASYKPTVNKLFDRIDELLSASTRPGSSVDMKFLTRLREDASHNQRDWQIRLDSYMQCLKDQGNISGADLNELLALASECPEPTPGNWDLLAPLVWLLVGAMSVMGWMMLAVPVAYQLWFAAAVALFGGLWGAKHYRRPASQPSRRKNRFHRLFLIGSGIVVGVLAAVHLPRGVKDVVELLGESRHAKHVSEFETAPDGFPLFQKIVKENFGVGVFLGDIKYSYQSTTLHLPGSSSASMNLTQGYCELSIDPWSVTRDFGPNSDADRKTWIFGVLFHELGHCLDVGRDLPAIGSSGEMHKFSLAPVDSKAVNDLGSYVAATKRQSTILWREAYSDIMAIGYWKIAAPGKAAALASELRSKRSANTLDVNHSTTCWIDKAIPAAAPTSLKELPAWADALRRSANCKA
jgi:hypothetical protein